MTVRTSPVKPPEQRPNWAALKPIPSSLASKRNPMIIGHRGGRGLAPENTLAAFQIAAELGIDGVEFDVQRTQDGHLIVFHDEDVARTTNSVGSVGTLTLNSIKTLDAGSSFELEYQGERVPTLHESFEFLKKTQLLLNIELKEPWRYPGIEDELIALIRQYDLVEQVQVRSFYHDALYTMYASAPEISLSGLWLTRLPSDDEVTFKTINGLFQLFDAETIARIHDRGQQATAWVVNNWEIANELIEAGIDAIATDYPDQLVALIDQYSTA